MRDNKLFFDRIKSLVKKQNTTIEYILNKAFPEERVSRNVYNGWRSRGNLPRADQAVSIAQILGTSVEYLVTGEKIGEDSLSVELHNNPKVKHLAKLALMLSDTRIDDLIGITEQWIEKQDITQESAG